METLLSVDHPLVWMKVLVRGDPPSPAIRRRALEFVQHVTALALEDLPAQASAAPPHGNAIDPVEGVVAEGPRAPEDLSSSSSSSTSAGGVG